MATSSVMVRLTTPGSSEDAGKEMHVVTEAAAVLYDEGNGVLTTVEDALNRTKIQMTDSEPEGSCIWAKPIDPSVGDVTNS